MVLGVVVSVGPGAATRNAHADNPEVPPRELVTYVLALGEGAQRVAPPVGTLGLHRVAAGDTFLDLARFHDVGYNELRAANPDVDPWVPPPGSDLVIPTQWLLPSGSREGIVVNVPELRLYYFLPASAGGSAEPLVRRILTYPVGLGRDEWRTPIGEFRIRGKTKNPTWVLPEAVKAERIAEKGFAEESIPGGHPDNPLGRHRIELTLPSYAIHGTNKNWGVGMQVSHGCVRLYPEDVAAIFPLVEVGGKGRFAYEPVKIGRGSNGRILVEVHPDIYGLTAGLEAAAWEQVRAAGVESEVDFGKLAAALEAASGLPTDVGHSRWPIAVVGRPLPARGEGDAGSVVLDARSEAKNGNSP